MKNISILLLTTILFSLVGCSKQIVTVYPQISVNYLRRMAILPFYNNQRQSPEGVDIADGIQTKLVEHIPQLDLVERQRIEDIAAEWKLVKKGYIDVETAVNIGKLVGARLIMTGQIKDLSITRESEMMYGSIRVSVRIIDVERGVIKWAKEVKVAYPDVWSRYRTYYRYTGVNEFKADMIDIVCDEVSKEFYTYEKEI